MKSEGGAYIYTLFWWHVVLTMLPFTSCPALTFRLGPFPHAAHDLEEPLVPLGGPRDQLGNQVGDPGTVQTLKQRGKEAGSGFRLLGVAEDTFG